MRNSFIRGGWPVLGVLLCLLPAARANDGWGIGGGSFYPVKGEHPSIQMEREWVRIDIDSDDYYDVKATFLFRNHGPATDVTMGFPENGGGSDIGGPLVPEGYYKNHSGFKSFESFVDSRRVNVRRVASRVSEESYQAYWVKRVPFAAGQQRKVVVRYRAPFAGAVGFGPLASYAFTGGNWRGRVKESSLEVVIHPPGTYLVQGMMGFKNVEGRRKDNHFYYQWNDWQAQDGFSFSVMATLPEGFNLNNDYGPLNFQEVRVPREDETAKTRILNWSPPVVRRAGRLFVHLSDLRGWFRAQLKKQDASRTYVELEWQQDTQSAIVRFYKSGIDRQLLHSLRFPSGQTAMIVDDKRAVPLTAAPFIDGQFRANSNFNGQGFYVPLEPIAELLGGTIEVKPDQRRVLFTAPSYWIPEKNGS